ncbi:hypothetical protein Bca52824_035094 [Brassica carinata]|uniref:F-box domain-containing protein n=1 Tax=Brassica carinata TaxID=52824 RepID=A0A8X7V1E6_BRACI|nr:hypothetical protein Bca52824_035094 [Brassica carinata]
MDLVSGLPDELLCHILSFLPTKHAALTSVLSKRWFNLWKLVPNLDIDDTVFLHPEDGKGEREEIRHSFVSFVDSVLAMQGQSPIKSFSLKCITGVHPDTVNGWICNVLQRGVSELDLFTDFSDEDTEEDMYTLPKEMFLSATLVKLKLRSERCVSWWQSSLPMLKSLDIDSDLVLFFADFEEIIPSFPVLEELRIANMEWHEFHITVSSASLRKLSLHCTGCGGVVIPKSVSFDTPNLLSLNYSDFVAEDYPLLNMENLLEARINFTVTDDQVKRVREPNNDEVLKFGNVVKLLNVIQNVQKLSLPSGTLEVLSLCTQSIPVFNNLKFLVVSSKEDRGWQAMPVLLRNCPHLDSLIIEHGTTTIHNGFFQVNSEVVTHSSNQERVYYTM